MPGQSIREHLGAVVLLALVLITGLASCARAPGSLILSDETASLDRGQLETAAAPLLARGATVIVLVADRSSAPGDDLTRRLDEAGLLTGGQVAANALVIYVNYAPRYSELRAGTRWSGRLSNATLRTIRTTVLNPALQQAELTAGVTATLEAFEARIANPPLIERLVRGVAAVMLVGFLLIVLAISPLGVRLGRWWRSSPPGRLVQWLRDQTPAGQRRLSRIIQATRLRMDDRADYARSWCRAARASAQREAVEALTARLNALDQQRRALTSSAQTGRSLQAEMDQLAVAYERLGSDAARLAPAQPQPGSKRKQRASASSPFIADSSSTTPGTRDASTSDHAADWDSGSFTDSGPSSDGGPW